MKIAHVVPRNHLDLSDLGDFDFVLAHLALKSKSYREHFTCRKGREVYLDNGVWETGRPASAQIMIELAIEMQPTYVYAPDYIGDAIQTVDAVRHFCALARTYLDFKSQIIATSQGSSRNVWFACIKKLSKIDGVDVIAIPRHPVRDMFEYEKNRGLRMTKTRLEMCRLIETDPTGFNGKRFYATGTGAAVCVRELLNYLWITGVDTTMACLLASENIRILGRFSEYKPDKQLDFDIEFTPEQLDAATFNIGVLNRWAHGEGSDG